MKIIGMVVLVAVCIAGCARDDGIYVAKAHIETASSLCDGQLSSITNATATYGRSLDAGPTSLSVTARCADGSYRSKSWKLTSSE